MAGVVAGGFEVVKGVLETLYSLAGVALAGDDDDNDATFRGHPLVARPAGAATAFYVLWPALVLGAAVVARAGR